MPVLDSHWKKSRSAGAPLDHGAPHNCVVPKHATVCVWCTVSLCGHFLCPFSRTVETSAQSIAHTETCFPQHVLPFGLHSRLIDNSPLFPSPKHQAPPLYNVANTNSDKWKRTQISLLYGLHITFPVMASTSW